MNISRPDTFPFSGLQSLSNALSLVTFISNLSICLYLVTIDIEILEDNRGIVVSRQNVDAEYM